MNNIVCWKELNFKDKLSYILCIFSFIIGVLLTIAGFVVKPLGEVDASVLTTFQTVSNHKKIGEARKGYKHSEETKKKIA